MTSFKQLMVNLIAAIAADRATRKSGIEVYVPAMLLVGPLLAMPLFVLLLSLLRLLTSAQPLRHEPYFALGVDSLCLGAIAAAELIRIWRVPIEAKLAEYGRLDPRVRTAQRVQWLLWGVATFILMLALLLLALER
jgi:hypothetical protein